MRLLSRLLLILSALIVILLIGSFILPQKQQVKRSVNIAAPAAQIYPYLVNPKKFTEWSPWSKIDPNMKVQFVGPESGVGAGMTWQSDQPSVGNGSWTIANAKVNESVDVNMDFGDQGLATSSFSILRSGNTNQVTWGFETDAGMNPIMRWMGLLMDKMVGSEYEKGLNELKAVMEKNTKTPNSGGETL